MRVMVIPIVVVALGNGLNRSEIGIGTVGNWRKNRAHSEYSIVEIGQNIKKSSGDPRRLAATQTPIKNFQLRLMEKKLARSSIIYIDNDKDSHNNNYDNQTERKENYTNKWLKSTKEIEILRIQIK